MRDIPATQAYGMIKRQEHPDELLSIKEEAEKQRLFDIAASKEFQRQLDEKDDPFPLEFHL